MLAYSGRDRIIAGYSTRAGKGPYAPANVHCIVLDAETGKVLGERQWTVIQTSVGLLAATGGRFAVRTSHRLVLYSSDFKPLAEFPLPIQPPGLDLWRVTVTPDRRSFVADHITETGATLEWLDSKNLMVTWSLDLPKEGYEDWISLIATNQSVAEIIGDVGLVQARDLQGPWRRVYAGDRMSMDVRFADDHTLLVGSRRQFLVLRDDGQLVSAETLGKGEFSEPAEARVSADGTRLAVPVITFKGGNLVLDIGQHEVLKRIMIFNLPSRRWVYELDAKKVNLKRIWATAISPDGSRLAFLRNSAVEAYQLPD